MKEKRAIVQLSDPHIRKTFQRKNLLLIIPTEFSFGIGGVGLQMLTNLYYLIHRQLSCIDGKLCIEG
jgi:hypothetical protein